jgi:hypothetical protein
VTESQGKRPLYDQLIFRPSAIMKPIPYIFFSFLCFLGYFMYYFYHPAVPKVEVDPRDRKSRRVTSSIRSADLLADCIPDIYASFQSVSEAILKETNEIVCFLKNSTEFKTCVFLRIFSLRNRILILKSGRSGKGQINNR